MPPSLFNTHTNKVNKEKTAIRNGIMTNPSKFIVINGVFILHPGRYKNRLMGYDEAQELIQRKNLQQGIGYIKDDQKQLFNPRTRRFIENNKRNRTRLEQYKDLYNPHTRRFIKNNKRNRTKLEQYKDNDTKECQSNVVDDSSTRRDDDDTSSMAIPLESLDEYVKTRQKNKYNAAFTLTLQSYQSHNIIKSINFNSYHHFSKLIHNVLVNQ